MSPLYAAVIDSVPIGSSVVVHCAVLEVLTATAPQPDIAEPLDLNSTVPVGVGGPAGETVAVKITDVPNVDGFRPDAIETDELNFTTCESPVLLLAA